MARVSQKLYRTLLTFREKSLPKHIVIVIINKSNMSENTFNVTSEDVRNLEAKQSKFNDGKTPKDSDVSALKV